MARRNRKLGKKKEVNPPQNGFMKLWYNSIEEMTKFLKLWSWSTTVFVSCVIGCLLFFFIFSSNLNTLAEAGKVKVDDANQIILFVLVGAAFVIFAFIWWVEWLSNEDERAQNKSEEVNKNIDELIVSSQRRLLVNILRHFPDEKKDGVPRDSLTLEQLEKLLNAQLTSASATMQLSVTRIAELQTADKKSLARIAKLNDEVADWRVKYEQALLAGQRRGKIEAKAEWKPEMVHFQNSWRTAVFQLHELSMRTADRDDLLWQVADLTGQLLVMEERILIEQALRRQSDARLRRQRKLVGRLRMDAMIASRHADERLARVLARAEELLLSERAEFQSSRNGQFRRIDDLHETIKALTSRLTKTEAQLVETEDSAAELLELLDRLTSSEDPELRQGRLNAAYEKVPENLR